MTNELPPGWEPATVGDVARFVRGVTYSKENAKKAFACCYCCFTTTITLSLTSILHFFPRVPMCQTHVWIFLTVPH